MFDSLQSKQFVELGSYCQQFMYIKLSSIEANVVLHEYVHHLQNVTSFYSISTFLCLKALCYDMIAKKRNWDDSTLTDKLFYKRRKFLQETLGERMDVQFDVVEFTGIDYYSNKESGQILNLTLHLLVDGEPRVYVFGTIVIKESMAHIIEKNYFAADATNNILTYRICEFLVCYLCPKLRDNFLIIVAILEASLVGSSPVNTLLAILQHLDSNEYEVLSPQIIYTIVSNSKVIRVNHRGEVTNPTIMELHNELYREIDTVLNLYYGSMSSSDSSIIAIMNWQKNVLKSSLELRKSNPLLITSMLETNGFAGIIDNPMSSHPIKIPLVVYGEYEQLIINDDNVDDFVEGNLLFLLVEEEIIMNVCDSQAYTKKSCGLKNICKKYVRHYGKTEYTSMSYKKNVPYEEHLKNKNVYDEKLCADPFSRSIHDFTCPFTFVWRKMLGS